MVEVVALEEATEVVDHTDPQEVVAAHVVMTILEMEVVVQVAAEVTEVVLRTMVVVVTATVDMVNKTVEAAVETGKEVGV